MSDKTELSTLAAVAVAMFIVMLFFSFAIVGIDYYFAITKAQTQCEAMLPRNEHCVMIFVPEGYKVYNPND